MQDYQTLLDIAKTEQTLRERRLRHPWRVPLRTGKRQGRTRPELVLRVELRWLAWPAVQFVRR